MSNELSKKESMKNASLRRGLRLGSRLQSLHFDCAYAVGEVDHEPNDQPDQQPYLVDPTQRVHHEPVGEENGKDRNQRYQRRPKRPRSAPD